MPISVVQLSPTGFQFPPSSQSFARQDKKLDSFTLSIFLSGTAKHTIVVLVKQPRLTAQVESREDPIPSAKLSATTPSALPFLFYYRKRSILFIAAIKRLYT